MAASSEKAPEPSTPRVITSDEGLTAWDIDPYKREYSVYDLSSKPLFAPKRTVRLMRVLFHFSRVLPVPGQHARPRLRCGAWIPAQRGRP